MTDTPQTYSEFLDSLPENERWFASVPPLCRAIFWMIAICKDALQGQMPDDFRWKFSKWLDAQRGDFFHEEMIAMMKPAGEVERELYAAAKSTLTFDEALKILMSDRMFDLLIQANSSVLAAIKYRHARGVGSAPPNYPLKPAEQSLGVPSEN